MGLCVTLSWHRINRWRCCKFINVSFSDYPEFNLPVMDVQIKQEPHDHENKYNPEDTNGDEDYNY